MGAGKNGKEVMDKRGLSTGHKRKEESWKTKQSLQFTEGGIKMRTKTLTCFLVIGFILFFCFGTIHAAGEVYKCRIASHMSSQDASGMACIKFGELLESKSEGRFKTTVANEGKMGNQREVVEQIRDGALEVTISLAGGPGHYKPEVQLLEAPYMYDDGAHMVRVLIAVRPYVAEILAPYNFKPFGYMNIGFRHMLNKKRPIRKVADLKGLKMRGPIPMYVEMFNALGARGTTVTWTEVYTALQSGVVDGMEASPSLIYAMKFQEQAKYLSKTYHIGANFYFIAGKKWFESLPKDLQEIFTEATEEASEFQIKMQDKLDQEAIDKLIAEKVKINEVDDLNEFRNKVLPWREKWVKSKGSGFEKIYQKMLAVK